MDYFSDPVFVAIFSIVLATRFLLPLTIFRWPLPGLIGCLVVDAVDQTVFQTFGYDPPFYQGYDKAMDVFYLGMAYIATLRNWVSIPAFGVGRFLFFYRQVGVVAFELSGARWLLLVFANTFEYFFIAYEMIRSRWSPLRMGLRGWVVTAALIWIFVKLPQEYWIHVAELDFTDTWHDVSWFPPLIIGGIAVIAAGIWFVVRPRLPRRDHALQITAPAMPEELDTPTKRSQFMAEHGRVWSQASLEKSVLIGLLLIIYASILPHVNVPPARMLGWTGIFVLLNVASTLALARRGFSSKALGRTFALRFMLNFVLLLIVNQLFYKTLQVGDAAFFVLIFSVLITAYDIYRPVFELRRYQAANEGSLNAP